MKSPAKATLVVLICSAATAAFGDADSSASSLPTSNSATVKQMTSDTPDFQSRYCALTFSRTNPSFSAFTLDSLGKGQLEQNPVLKDAASSATPVVKFEQSQPGLFTYSRNADKAWTIRCEEKRITLRSEYANASPPAPPFVLAFDQKANHATLLGLMKPGDRRMQLPCLLHLPDLGSARITCDIEGRTLNYDARRYVKPPFVRVEFPSATAEHPKIEYTLEIVALHPALPGIEGNPLYDGYRRSFLNIFQVNPRVQMLANNSSSDPVPFTLFKYAEVAAAAPPLAEGLTCLDLVRMTLDQYMVGVLGYGMKGYAVTPSDADLIAWKTPWTSLDTTPSLVLAAAIYIESSGDQAWAHANYGKIAEWARHMMSADSNGNGLIEYPATGNLGDRATPERRPANWWDTINFGHEDAYSNALAYRACVKLADVARALGHTDDAAQFSERAAKLRAAYLPAFLNPATGIIAGWRSADGKLHDYWFTFVSAAAITYGLIDDKDANPIMDRILKKMDQVGYSNFHLGLPGNLVPVIKADYCLSNWPDARDTGEPSQDDGLDAFQRYENGGATGCYSYFTIAALYKLGRPDDARRIFHPMLESYAKGDFQGFCASGKSRDWRDWNGGCYGYEGLLVDNYLPLLAVRDDLMKR